MSRHPQVIAKRADFLAANRGIRVAQPGFVLLVYPNGGGDGGPNSGRGRRYGITVTKKIGNAVVRNRMKRRFRELLWAALPVRGLPDHDHVLIGREGGLERDFASLAAELDHALERAAAGKGDRRRGRSSGPSRGPRR
ncbi:ribonuclease P protein component [Erythrobacter sp. QSSC1-22B]|uniref:ribonuclease P protein component n=1 Tax=Erythrobacter sp. QSSC1-22B TaxID=1860125 RepID=UPI00080544BC|nr:ribonuclease P protein component [Erythrobacter sp. QSSC1-22B]OBX18761.1 ribonuclease P protein component [Erythrobacter sp. QSSC1-22B]